MELINAKAGEPNMTLTKAIESLGYERAISSWDRQALDRISVTFVPHPMWGGENTGQFERVIDDTNVWQIYVSENNIKIVHAVKITINRLIFNYTTISEATGAPEYDINFETLFNGNVENSEDLLKVLKQVGAPFDTTT